MDDTIVAIATPPGQSGVGIIRLSGPDARQIALGCFEPASQAPNWQSQPRHMHLGRILDPVSRDIIDQVLLCIMPAPHSYTCQDVVEIQAHGGPLPLREIVSVCLAGGARLASPGEFTLRAFVNGRLDLAQAEAVLDTIQAETTAALHIAQKQLAGKLSAAIKAIRQELVLLLGYLQARADFPEDDVPVKNILPEIADAGARLEELLKQSHQGMLYRQGVRTAIVGRPNVGKSSLLNCLLGTERAIVTDIPGTTRDTLNETIDLDGIPFELVDTAGIWSSVNPVEILGVERSRQAIATADLVLLVVDASQPASIADMQVASLINGKQALVVLNKCDLAPLYSFDELLPDADRVEISALTGLGLGTFRQTMANLVTGGMVTASQEALVSNPRHQRALADTLASLQRVREAAEQGVFQDLWAIDLAEALRLLGEITGETAGEELLDTIFSNFCIGK
ncbi:MAG: tRNA uridine-5-carboxymethylaminomethyl(34) synthesis GTPase MnmE [Anaerolineae bacterium]